MKTSPCFGQQSYKADTDKIDSLPEEMKKLWIDTKVKQLELRHQIKLKPISVDEMNVVCLDAMNRADDILEPYGSICCSVSGGSDSDVVMDMLARSSKKFRDIHFVFFDTGLEYQATKDHLSELEEKYGVKIERERAVKSIPTSCKEYGVPFLSKWISEMIQRLQRHGFQWEDEEYDVLKERYPQCLAGLRWWCNWYNKGSKYNITYHKGLKEYMLAHPIPFKVSNKCCTYAKKKVGDRYNKKIDADLVITGVRKAERGARADAYKSCHTHSEGISTYRPIFWFKDSDKEKYVAACDIHNSDCYTVYGLDRTGCCGCPFGKNFENELEILRIYEPKLYTAVNNVFGVSYEYTRGYLEFRKQI